MKVRSAGLSYQGSKKAMAGELTQFFSFYLKDDTPFVELFVGGFSIAPLLTNGKRRVITSDIQPYATSLMREYVVGGREIPYYWVSREMFDECVKNPDKYEDYEVAYCRFFWSFGSAGNSYFCEPEKERFYERSWRFIFETVKELGLTPSNFYRLNRLYGEEFCDLVVGKCSQSVIDDYLECYNYYQESDSELRIPFFSLVRNLHAMQELPFQETLEMYVNDYRETPVPDGAVVYCDPPYFQTTGYGMGFDFEAFWNYMRKLSETHIVFVSEYSMPDDFIPIYKVTRSNAMGNSSRVEGEGQTHVEEVVFVHKSLLDKGVVRSYISAPKVVLSLFD